MAKLFRQAFIEHLARTGKTLAEVARGAGVSVEQLKKVKQRDTASTNVDDGVKIAHYFGLSMDEFLSDTLIQDRTEMMETYFQLTDQERQFLRDIGEVRRARGREAG